jgi:hypothetical protein
LYKVNFTGFPRKSTPCESEIDEVEMREVGPIACEYVLRLDIAMNDVVAVDVLQGGQLYQRIQ